MTCRVGESSYSLCKPIDEKKAIGGSLAGVRDYSKEINQMISPILEGVWWLAVHWEFDWAYI